MTMPIETLVELWTQQEVRITDLSRAEGVSRQAIQQRLKKRGHDRSSGFAGRVVWIRTRRRERAAKARAEASRERARWRARVARRMDMADTLRHSWGLLGYPSLKAAQGMVGHYFPGHRCGRRPRQTTPQERVVLVRAAISGEHGAWKRLGYKNRAAFMSTAHYLSPDFGATSATQRLAAVALLGGETLATDAALAAGARKYMGSCWARRRPDIFASRKTRRQGYPIMLLLTEKGRQLAEEWRDALEGPPPAGELEA